MTAAATEVLRPGALRGRVVLLAGGAPTAAARCAALGADVRILDADLRDEDAVLAAAGAVADVDVLVVDADAPFRDGGGGLPGLRLAVDGAWNAVRATVRAQWMGERGGAIVLLAPRAGAGEHAGAVRAALENTARTVSTEWARLSITPTAVLPGAATTQPEVDEVTAFLASPAGAYYSGCAFTLGAA